MLDDLKYIAAKDSADAFGIAAKAPDQLRHEFSVGSVSGEINSMVVSGMGGSALGASLFLNWTQPSVPMAINRQYDIPGFVSQRTLFVASSYSGNTEEALSAYRQARERGAVAVAMTSGGKLEELAKENGVLVLKLPGGIQPRMSVFYQIKALSALFDAVSAFGAGDLAVQVSACADFLAEESKRWLPEVRTEANLAKQLAGEIAGKTPVIYAGPRLSGAAYKWKISFNETSKNIAFYNQWPEFNHNEIMGWTSHPVEKPFQPVELISAFEHPRVSKRFEISNRLLSGKMPHPLVIETKGDTLLAQILWAVLLGDFTSLYLAMLNGVDPTPVKTIEKLKQELSEESSFF